jgi:alpha-galactosidase
MDGYVAIMKVIYETALECNPDAVILNCPCGTPMTPQWMTWQNQAVTVDPWTSWVNRGAFKEMKGLFGPRAPVVLDHIEISDEGEDFSILGVGGVPATRFTPSGRDRTNEIEDRIFDVRPFDEKLKLWKHWFGIYNEMRLSEGEYLNLYDLVFDIPETHVIKKEHTLYFSIYPGVPDGIVDDGGVEYRQKKHSKKWTGDFSFRGLDSGLNYQVRDWENDVILCELKGSHPTLKLDIDHHLLLELKVIDNPGKA